MLTLEPNDICPDCGDVLSLFEGRYGDILGKCLTCGTVYKIEDNKTGKDW